MERKVNHDFRVKEEKTLWNKKSAQTHRHQWDQGTREESVTAEKRKRGH